MNFWGNMINEYILKNILNTELYDPDSYVRYDKSLTFFLSKDQSFKFPQRQTPKYPAETRHLKFMQILKINSVCSSLEFSIYRPLKHSKKLKRKGKLTDIEEESGYFLIADGQGNFIESGKGN